MLGSKLHRGRAEDRIHARGEDADGRAAGSKPGVALGIVQFEIDQRAFAAADPVALHGADFFRPAFQLVQALKQFIGILCGTYKPLFKLALPNNSIFMPPATAVHDLLIRQYRRTLRAPVHLALLAIGQSLLKKLEEEPLVPAIIFRQASGDLARPVIGKAEAIHLRLHIRDVAQRPLARRRVVLNRRVFRRQAKRIPAHGMKHVVAVHPHVAGQRVADGIIAHVSHVQRARGIRQHFEHVIFFLGRVGLGRIERGILLPALEPLRLDALRIVAFVVAFRVRTFGLSHSAFRFFFLRHSEDRVL